MGALPLGLSVHNFISSVGADAGFASIIGLAILVLLYFAHARETSALREQAARLAERLQQAEAKLAQAGGAQGTSSGTPVGAPPAPAAAPAAQTAAAPAAQTAAATSGVVAAGAFARGAHGPPAGLAAPALASATRFVAVGAPAQAGFTPAAARQAAAAASIPRPAVPAAAMQPGAATALAAAAAAPAEPPEEQRVPVGAPATAAGSGAANGGAGSAPAAIPSPPVRRPPSRVPPGTARPAGGARRPLPPLATSGPRPSSGARRFALLALGALVVAGGVVALILATSASPKRSITTLTPTSNAPSANHPAPAAFNPASVTVAVLNGTATNDLAHRVSARLAAMGYRKGNIATATDQTRTSTVVAYMPGYRQDAVHVASVLRLGPASVRPIDQSTQQVACSGTSACKANVVVTVGADLATL